MKHALFLLALAPLRLALSAAPDRPVLVPRRLGGLTTHTAVGLVLSPLHPAYTAFDWTNRSRMYLNRQPGLAYRLSGGLLINPFVLRNQGFDLRRDVLTPLRPDLWPAEEWDMGNSRVVFRKSASTGFTLGMLDKVATRDSFRRERAVNCASPGA